MKRVLIFMVAVFISWPAGAQEITAKRVSVKNDFFEKPDPKAEVWNEASEAPVTLFPQNITTPSLTQTTVPALKARAVHDGQWLAVRLEWADSAKNVHLETDLASDACAIQFPLKVAGKTSPFMGAREAPVEIIHWKAIWQNDLEKGFLKVTDLYPNTWVDTYRFGKNVAADVGNPLSDAKRAKPVEELAAAGFGSLTHQSQLDSNARGVWENGKWTVVLVHKMRTGDANDPVLKPGQKTAIAFAVWEGGAKNVGARKNYAPWITLNLEK